MIILMIVHLVVVAIEFVIGNDEPIRVGIVVVRRNVQDVLALHVGGGNCDVVAIVVLGRASAARAGATRAAARRGAAAPAARIRTGRVAAGTGAAARRTATRATGPTRCARATPVARPRPRCRRPPRRRGLRP